MGVSVGAVSDARKRLPPDTEERVGKFTEVLATAIANTESRAELAASEARAHRLALEIRIRDHGVGGARRDGSGLVGLRDRVEALGGTMTIDSPDGRGTTLVAKLPLDDTPGAALPTRSTGAGGGR